MAGSGFVRRFNYSVGTEVITQIEGINIIDLPPPGNIQGVATGVACLVAEFVDNTYGIAVDTNGNVTQSPNPVQIFSAQDLLDKVGGFDPTIGDFGGSMGNGFVELRNKSFSSLVLVPVPNCSPRATRYWRKLPYNTNQTSVLPVVPMQGALVPAGTPFIAGSSQVNTAAPVRFSGLAAYISGTDGVVTASTGTTETFNTVTGNFVNNGVQVGDAIVIGAPIISALVSSPTGSLYIGATDTFIYLQSPGYTAYAPSGGLLQIDSEFVTYAGTTNGASGTAFTGVTRAVNASVGATHAVGAVVAGMSNVDTYRINAVPGATQLTLERQNGTTFATTNSFGASAQPWRVHHRTDAESGIGIFSNAAAYTVPARPVTATIASATLLAPVTVPPAQTYNTSDPLSGLAGRTDPTTGLVYAPATQAANAVSSASMDALYSTAITAMLSQNLPEATVNILWAARKSANIRSALRQSVDTESSIGVGRLAVISPDHQSVTSTTLAVAAADPGVGGQRDERVIYSWPAVQTYIPEAVNYLIKGADLKYYTNGIIDVTADSYFVAVLSNLAPERNPGQAAPPVPSVLASVAGLSRNAPMSLGINDYTAFRQSGICAIKIDNTIGPVFQSGVTTSLVSGTTTIQRRRMADFCQDSIAQALAPLAKLPLTLQFKDNVTTECDSFLNGLVSPDNPAQQRINAYYVDDQGGNTAALNALGVYVVIIGIQTTPTADFIVLQFNVGNGVVIPTQIK